MTLYEQIQNLENVATEKALQCIGNPQAWKEWADIVEAIHDVKDKIEDLKIKEVA